MNFNIWFYSILIVAILIIITKFFPRQNRRHKRYQRYAVNIYNKIKTLEYEGQKLNYLKKINPYVFEELILYALLQKGHKIIRNKSYSNDGGIDGKFYIENQLYFIQAKRYQNHINKKHVIDFEKTVIENNVKGIFCHTGRTGKGSKEFIYKSNYIELYSGSKLLKLLGI